MAEDVQKLIQSGMQQYRMQRSPLPPPARIRTSQPSNLANSHKQSSIVYSVQSGDGNIGSETQLCSAEIQSQDQQIRQLKTQISDLARLCRPDQVGLNTILQCCSSNDLTNANILKTDDSESDEFFIKKQRFQAKMEIQQRRDDALVAMIAETMGINFDDLEDAVKGLFA